MAGKAKGLSIIDKGLKVEGSVHADGKLVIAGSLQGTLTGNEVVTVEGSTVVARTEVRDLIVAGAFEGDITAYGSLKILRTGNIGGNITCSDLSLEAGGKLNGHVRPLAVEQEEPVPAAAETSS